MLRSLIMALTGMVPQWTVTNYWELQKPFSSKPAIRLYESGQWITATHSGDSYPKST